MPVQGGFRSRAGDADYDVGRTSGGGLDGGDPRFRLVAKPRSMNWVARRSSYNNKCGSGLANREKIRASASKSALPKFEVGKYVVLARANHRGELNKLEHVGGTLLGGVHGWSSASVRCGGHCHERGE